MTTPFDFGRLVNALTNNGQAHLPPQDVIRMGEIVGYDPNWDSDSGAHSYPMVSVQLAGDESPMHGLRFAESYVPNLGDTVFVVVSGEDGWVLSALAGASKDVIGQTRSPVSLLKGSAFTDTTVIPSNGTVTTLPNTDQSVPYLPNRIYRIEATVTFSVSGVAQVSGSVGVSPSITATNNTYGTTGGGSVTPLTVTATNNSGSGAVATTSTIPSMPSIQMVSFRAYFSGTGDTSLTNVEALSGTTIAQIQAIVNVSGANAMIADLEGTRIAPNTAVTGTTSAGGGTVNINNGGIIGTGGGVTTGAGRLFLVISQSPPAVTSTTTHTWPAITADVGGSITWPSITTTASSTGSFTNSTQNSEVSIGVITPDGYQEMTRYDVTGAKDNQQFTVSASTTFWKIPSGPITPDSWTSTFNWNLAMQTVGTVKPTITNISQRFLIYDCGVAS